MAIDPLATALPPTLSTPRPPAALRGNASFSGIMEALAAAAGSSAKGEGLAAELLRIEMMKSSLAISGEAPSIQSPGLADLLKGLESYRHAAETVAAAPAAGTEAPPATEETPATGEITRTASQFLGVPYLFGGESATGIDCSSFVQQVFREHRIELPRTAREQMKVGADVAPGDLKEGDLVFFQTYASYPSHVGIYLGNGKMIHASSRHGEVTVSDMTTDYFRSRFLGAKRVS